MALTRITKGVIKPNENYDTHNINSTGIVTAIGLDINGSGDISGNLSVGGVLTYEDVTSIDSVGIITAQSDIHVGAGVSAVGVGTFGSLDIGGDIDVDGHTNLDNVSVAGIITSGVNVHTPYVYMSGVQPGVAFNETDSENDFTIGLQSGIWKLRDVDGGVDRYQVNSSGQHTFIGSVAMNGGGVTINKDLDVDGHTNLDNVSVAGVSTFTGAIDANGDLDVDGHTNLDNVSIAGVTTMNSTLNIVSAQPLIYLNNTSYENDYQVQNLAGTFTVRDVDRGNNVFQIGKTGLSTFSGQLDVQGNVTLDRDLDVDGHTNLDNVNIAGVTTTSADFNVGGHVVSDGTSNRGGIFGKLSIGYDNTYLTLQPTSGNTQLHLNFNNGNEVHVGHSGGSTLTVNGNIKPKTDSASDLGLTGTRFRAAYVDTYYGDGSNLTGISGISVANQADNRLITATGTTDSLNAETALTFYQAGNDSILTIEGTNSAGHAQLTLKTGGTTDHCSINFGDSADHDAGEIRYTNSSDSLNFDTAGAARMVLDSSGNLYPNTSDTQALGQSDKRWKRLYLGQGGELQIGDATDNNWFGITEGIRGTFTDQDFLSLYYRNTLRFFSNSNNERVRFDASGNMTFYNGNIIGNSSHTMEIGNITSGAIRKIRMCQGGELHFGDTTSSNFLGITEGIVNTFTDQDYISIYYRNSLKFFSNNNTQRLLIDSSGHILPAANNTIDLGSNSLRFRNIHTNDLNLSNEGNSNEVDGTWGDWTLQEGKNDIFMINRRNGKKFKINMTEID